MAFASAANRRPIPPKPTTPIVRPSELHAHRGLIPASGAQLRIEAWNVARGGEQQRQRVLGHGVVGVSGTVADGDSLLRRPPEVDESGCADPGEHHQLERRRRLHHLGGKVPPEQDRPGVSDAPKIRLVTLRAPVVHHEAAKRVELGPARLAQLVTEVLPRVGIHDDRHGYRQPEVRNGHPRAMDDGFSQINGLPDDGRGRVRCSRNRRGWSRPRRSGVPRTRECRACSTSPACARRLTRLATPVASSIAAIGRICAGGTDGLESPGALRSLEKRRHDD